MAMQPQTSTYEKTTHTGFDFTKRVTSLWMIDFDDCHDITMDEAGVNKAVSAFLETNHYCPKPNTGNPFIESLWKDFSTRYYLYSRNILNKRLESELSSLPSMFIETIIRRTTARKEDSPSTRSPETCREITISNWEFRCADYQPISRSW
ncbi:hypothetical protein LX36DRAFT_710905 [Colletotrichum falcatum]|nr:hypothetical protein LX36DRAFT_710905 [Colletotrichum falcatum]